jgi:hypothetical protein
MRVPVIIVTERQEPLVESFVAEMLHRAPRIPLQETRLPANITIDPAATAVPLGTGAPGFDLQSLRPEESQAYAVAGYAEVEDPAEIPESYNGSPVFANPAIENFLTCGGTPAVGNADDVAMKLQMSKLHEMGMTGDNVAVAIMDTGINLAHLRDRLGRMPRLDAANSWSVPGSGIQPGQHPVGHGTMCAYDALIAAPDATLLDFPILRSNVSGGSAMAGALSTALITFSQLLASWAVTFGAGGLGNYDALVVNNSWGIFHPSWDFPPGHPGRYCDNPNHPFNLIAATLAQANIDILFAAGNCGSQCADGRCQARVSETIMGANAHEGVLTLAGCDVNDKRVGYSSEGPSINGMYQEKPDLTAYTHFNGSEVSGPGSPDTGTSTACPVAAGCVAALRTKISPQRRPPANLFAQLRATARKVDGATSWNGQYGHGIIDPVSAAKTMGA